MPEKARGSRGFIIGIAILAVLFALGAALAIGGARMWADRPMINSGTGNQA
ncbi:MAG: hypothetical protein LBH66_02015 [Oscillospiraceae bacterium]|jgi:hypothetical protein|nr:hypothetical protein [Oscillospiraceae bacterium]